MRLLLHAIGRFPALWARYEYAVDVLRASGYDADRWHTPGEMPESIPEDAVVFMHGFVPDAVRALAPGRVWGGKHLSRSEQMNLLASLGVPCMEWLRVGRTDAIAQLNNWDGLVIVKRDGAHSGQDWRIWTSAQADYSDLDQGRDIVCREVNPNDGTVYRIELFAGVVVAQYVLTKKPLRQRILRYADGRQVLEDYRPDCELPDERYRQWVTLSESVLEPLRTASAALTYTHGLGLVALEMMRRPDTTLVAIELNEGNIGTWWTERHPDTKVRFAAACVSWAAQVVH